MNSYPCVLTYLSHLPHWSNKLVWSRSVVIWPMRHYKGDTSRGLKSTCALGLLCSAVYWESRANRRRLRWPDADVTQLTASSTARHVREAVPSDGCHCPRTQVRPADCPGVPACAANHRITSTENRCFQTVFVCFVSQWQLIQGM
jgi:hypothetical protein